MVLCSPSMRRAMHSRPELPCAQTHIYSTRTAFQAVRAVPHHVGLKYPAHGAMHRLNSFIKRAFKVSSGTTFGAHFCSRVIQPKSAVTSSGGYSPNLISKNTGTTGASFTPRYRAGHGRRICSIKISKSWHVHDHRLVRRLKARCRHVALVHDIIDRVGFFGAPRRWPVMERGGDGSASMGARLAPRSALLKAVGPNFRLAMTRSARLRTGRKHTKAPWNVAPKLLDHVADAA